MNPFTFDWDAEVEPAERDRLLNSLADRIVHQGVATPVQWLLAVHQPMMNVASQFAITLSPFLAALFTGGASDMQKYTKLMQQRENVDILIDLIDLKNLEGTVAAR